ncbi:NAD(+) diphosphatase [Actinophytocola algeriensis]|uniref:NAD(+) diphosphatase n=1 Tax=Actinophytocola algeriensis TaxID=1768010 RepID=A0A7W7Q942_9PSEU|nr:NAD(+) diphosphatase [Actinophytocola algeriensis]MBB4909247.1 NAD+ diphosphatase [Actinophytocola algeriensis]
MPKNVTLPYNGLALDRGRRGDPDWLAAAATTGRVLAFWRDRCLVAGGEPVNLTASLRETVFLGEGAVAVFAVDLSDVDEAAAVGEADADEAVDIRGLFTGLDPQEAATLAYARGMLHWARNQRFCGACGGETAAEQAGHVLRCQGCRKMHFPRIEPAVIMLVTSQDRRRCLLARHRGATAYSTLAGFLEIGESLEDAVRRELAEEAGVRVSEVVYQASQAWPFPSGLMVGYRAVAETDEFAVDHDELDEARWFTRAEVRALGASRPDSIESYLVGEWLAEEQ